MINLVASKEGEKAGFVADLAFGPRGNAAIFASSPLIDGSNHIINQLYAYYNINDKLTFTMGNFNTFLGYEVISPAANFNYSTSYMFSYGPFSHTGAKLDIGITDELSAMVGVFNPTDSKTLGANSAMYGAQLGYATDVMGIYLNYLGGNTGGYGSDTTGYNQIDLTAGFDVSDELYLGLNATIASQSAFPSATDLQQKSSGFSGVALYAQYAVSDALSLGVRAESFTDKNGFTGYVPQFTTDKDDAAQLNTKGGVIDLTLTAQYKVGDLTIIPELRVDMFNKLNKADDNTDGMPEWDDSDLGDRSDLKKGISSFGLAAVYAF